mmetsp:Transcript_43512/g.86367  ORF Transcript_43512/g.86367 Transcript_43512/m.86367 type:complete len:213 (+) Transcript_43512:70-708(+)
MEATVEADGMRSHSHGTSCCCVSSSREEMLRSCRCRRLAAVLALVLRRVSGICRNTLSTRVRDLHFHRNLGCSVGSSREEMLRPCRCKLLAAVLALVVRRVFGICRSTPGMKVHEQWCEQMGWALKPPNRRQRGKRASYWQLLMVFCHKTMGFSFNAVPEVLALDVRKLLKSCRCGPGVRVTALALVVRKMAGNLSLMDCAEVLNFRAFAWM